jgi:hypothetical protein
MRHLVCVFTRGVHQWLAVAYSLVLDQLSCGWYEAVDAPRPKESTGCPVKKLSNLTQSAFQGKPAHE